MKLSGKNDTFKSSMLESALFKPLRIVNPPSWIGHIPFVNFLIKETQPSVVVELGTHTGNSYLAICQTVQESAINAHCFAIDTWEGDEHALHYDNEIYLDLAEYHDQRYAAFSTLLRKTFDQAVHRFEDKSISLLHIDGLHTYDAVKHDFLTWLPKLAPGAIVLFHDTEEKNRGFGVYRFWEELKHDYQDMFSFSHSSGLGVLRIPSETNTEPAWIKPAVRDNINFTNYFETLGLNLMSAFKNKQLVNQLHSLASEDACQRRQAEFMENLFEELRPLNELISGLEFQINNKTTELSNKDADIRSLKHSTSWRLTKPVRAIPTQIRLIREEGPASRSQAILGYLTHSAKKTAQRFFPRAVNRFKSIILRVRPRLGIGRGYLSLNIQQSASGEGTAPEHYRIDNFYQEWSANFDTPSSEFLNFISTRVYHDKLTLVIARFSDRNIQNLSTFINAMQKCVGRHWNVLFAFEPSVEIEAAKGLIQAASNSDPRFVFAIQDLPVKPEYWICLDGSVTPREHSLYMLGYYLDHNQNALLAYSDEDRYESGRKCDPWFKPAYSSLLAEQGVLLGDMVAVRPGIDITEDWLAASLNNPQEMHRRIISLAQEIGGKRIIHIPYVLFHAASRAPIEHLELAPPSGGESVSIIIPTRDRWDLLKACLDSIKITDWPQARYEIIIVDNGSTDNETLINLERLVQTGDIRVVRSAEPFNWSKLNNLGVEHAKGDFFIFLNNDVEILDPQWIRKLVSLAAQKDIGAVGCKLLYPDHTVQHGGVIGGINGTAGHGHLFIADSEPGYRGLASITHESIAITGACLAVAREKFVAAGGFKPDFRVAFNDVVFCFDQHLQGRSNIYIGEPLMVHHESKSRGYDDTPEKIARNHAESCLTWEKYPDLLRADPYYSPNLSLKMPYQLPFVPRRPRIEANYTGRRKKIMMLSATHARGHGVAVVIDLQAAALVAAGYEVVIAGPVTQNDFPYPGCTRIETKDPESAALEAYKLDVDIIIAHTPPFYSVARWVGDHPKVIAYDYGEPPSDWFPDAPHRAAQNTEKALALRMSHAVYAISNAIKDESSWPVTGILRLGNAHLGRWHESHSDLRHQVRTKHGWDNKIVILNVCRFHRGERYYKGVDISTQVQKALRQLDPELFSRVVFVHCGKGNPQDVKSLEDDGYTVFANVSDQEVLALYAAADLYANFSQWEGYNLGIGQALAMGLPTIASDIPAHRAFGITTTNSPEIAAAWIQSIQQKESTRTATVWEWNEPLANLVNIIDSATAR